MMTHTLPNPEQARAYADGNRVLAVVVGGDKQGQPYQQGHDGNGSHVFHASMMRLFMAEGQGF
jgi:hypothetical protein